MHRRFKYNYNFITSSLNFIPRSAKFLNISKLVLAGENNIISPGIASSFALSTASFKFVNETSSGLHESMCNRQHDVSHPPPNDCKAHDLPYVDDAPNSCDTHCGISCLC